MNDFLLDDEEEQASEDLFGIADYYSPSSYSSLPPGASRDDLVSSLQSEISSGTDMMKEGKRLSLYEDDDLPGTKGSLAAASIFGLLPIALGAAFAGKKGALWGSNAGVAGAKPLLNRVAEQQAKAQETGLGIFKEGAARRANAEKSIAALKKDEFKEEAANARSDQSFNRQKELIDYRAAKGPNGGSVSSQASAFSTPEDFETYKNVDIAGLKSIGVPDELLEPLKLIKDPDAYDKKAYEVRRLLETKGVGERVEQAADKLDLLKGQQVFGGYKNLPGARTLTTTEQNDISKAQQGTVSAINNLEQQKALIKKNGTLDITGVDAAMQKALSGEYFNINRIRTNSGANFTEMEKDLIAAMSVASAAGGNPVQAAKDLALNRDPVQVLEGIQSLLQRDMDARLISLGRFREGAEYSPKVLESLNINPSDLVDAPSGNANSLESQIQSQLPKGVKILGIKKKS